MKSTGEVLGIGKTLNEALFKGLVSAGFKLGKHEQDRKSGVYMTVGDTDKFEIVQLAKKFSDLGFTIYATSGTARAISSLGIDVVSVPKFADGDMVLELLESGNIEYIVYTGASKPTSIRDYIRFHRHALRLGIPCLSSLDTASALADIVASRFTQSNTELVDMAHMRTERQQISFWKMEGTGNDYIFIDNFDGEITCPESLATTLADRHYGIGGDGIILIEKSDIADVKIRIYNLDGSQAEMAGNGIRCVAKYVHDKGIVQKDNLTVETLSGVKKLKLYSISGSVTSVCVDMGKAILEPAKIPVNIDGKDAINVPVTIGGKDWLISCISVGNPHCVVFVDHLEALDLEKIGPAFENADIFPERTNTEFIRVVNKSTIKMRAWERSNGETWSCGTGACAAVVAACENGLCNKGDDIIVKLHGGDLIVNYTDDTVMLTGNANLVYKGTAEY